MEIAATAAMAKLGQSLQQQRNSLSSNRLAPSKNETPSMNNMYASQYYDMARADECARGTANWNAAKNPFKTGMVPEPAYASMFQPLSADLTPPKTLNAPSHAHVSTLAGTTVSREDFTHNNMQHFYGSKIKQNMVPEGTSSILESRTGRSDVKQRKQAVECFFEPSAGNSYVCGMPDSSDFARNRIPEFSRRANDFPIDKVYVGPGIGQGFKASPEGGYQQAVTLDYVMPKNVDELRVATKPKLVPELKGPQGHMQGINQRGQIGSVGKNRPDKYYEQTQDMLLTTTGDHLKESLQPEQVVKATSRVETHVDYTGAAQKSASQPGIGATYDYGKDGIMTYNNERDITGTRSVVNNVTSYVKAVVAPLLDIFRHSQKEYTLDAARVYGSVQAQIPSKPTTYDPVTGAMRTTVREQLDDAPRVYGNIQAQIPSKATTYDPVTGAMRTTVREQLDDAPRMYGTMQAQVPSKSTTYDPVTGIMRTTVREQLDDAPRIYGTMKAQIPSKATTYDPVLGVMKTTIKEQTIHDTNISNPRGIDAPPVEGDDDARTTNRQTMPVVETMVNMAAHTYNVTVYDVDTVAKTTVRQTTPESGSMYGFIGGDATDKAGAYSVIDVVMPLTQKQFISDTEYTGSGESKTDFRPMSQTADYNAEIDGTREMMNITAGNTPSAAGAFIGLAKEQIDMQVKRVISDSVASRETGNTRGIQKGVLPIETCEVTHPVARELDNPQVGRLDGSLLSGLQSNPYNININPPMKDT